MKLPVDVMKVSGYDAKFEFVEDERLAISQLKDALELYYHAAARAAQSDEEIIFGAEGGVELFVNETRMRFVIASPNIGGEVYLMWDERPHRDGKYRREYMPTEYFGYGWLAIVLPRRMNDKFYLAAYKGIYNTPCPPPRSAVAAAVFLVRHQQA